MTIDWILFDWGWTLAEVNGQVEAFRRGATAVTSLLTGETDQDAVENLLAEALEAEIRASKDPRHREIDLGELLASWAVKRGRQVNQDVVRNAVEIVGHNWIGALEPIPGAIDAVGCLKDAGFRMGLVSNCFLPPEYCRREFARHGFADLLDFSLFSSELGYRKPSAVVYETALRRAGIDGAAPDLSRVLFVGDSPAYDVTVPASMGMKTALVESHHGFWTSADFERAKPDLRLRNVAELPALLIQG